MTTYPECRNITIDAEAIYLANAKGFAGRGDAAMYSEADARTDAAAYETEVLDILSNQLAKRAPGRAVLDAIAATGQPVRVQPVSTVATKGRQQYQLDDAHMNAEGLPRGPDGKYRGTLTLVHFTPDAEERGNDARAGMRADEVLLHELVHALGMVAGHLFNTPMGDEFDDEDEFKAILVTNIYSSEIGRPLRLSHHGLLSATGAGFTELSNPLTGPLADSDEYLRKYYPVIKKVIEAHWVMANTLGGLEYIRFNPIAKYLHPRRPTTSPFATRCVR